MQRVYPGRDLATCDQEPIHIPGHIQPHGCLIAFRIDDSKVVYASRNTSEFLGRAPEDMLGQSARALFPEMTYALLFSSVGSWSTHLSGPWFVDGARGPLAVHGHRHQNVCIIEFEDSPAAGENEAYAVFGRVRSMLSQLRSAKDLTELCESAVEAFRALTQFDRVTIYRFDRRWNGEVVAESRVPSAEPYLGLHFPASDIPAQARALYTRNMLRHTPDVGYEAVPLVAHVDVGGAPLDLSHAVLRSISPIHVEYLHNMGATASLSVSLLKDNALWGLISGVELSGPKPLSPALRAGCALFAEAVSNLLLVKEEYQDFDARRARQGILSGILNTLSLSPDFFLGLQNTAGELCALTGASSVYVLHNERSFGHGDAIPDETTLERIKEWLAHHGAGDVFETDSLANLWPEAAAWKECASGMLAVSLSKSFRNCVIWFRPEVLQTISWGGNPYKPVHAAAGQVRLHPRKSFQAWSETVAMHAPRWKEFEVEAALALRSSILESVIARSEEILKLNRELERSNDELDSFAYAASHDLKEPLRGIHNFTGLALRDLRVAGGEKTTAQERLETVVKLTQRMEALINSLLYYAQVGRMELSLRGVSLQDVVEQAVEMLKMRIEEEHAQVTVRGPLPVVSCDRVRVAEVFTNLLTNALKYNEHALKLIEIGCETMTTRDGSALSVFFVRDNGIGIAPEYQDRIFKIFKRLHSRDRYGGGTGTGLTITKRIVERHGGRIWVESAPGQGSTFRFTLAPIDPREASHAHAHAD